MKISFGSLIFPFAVVAVAVPLSTRANLQYTGDITHYSTGLGSCGITNRDTDAIVALSVPMMNNGANPNTNPLCGKTISVFNPTTGTTTQATVVDTCQACAYADVDMSPTLFTTVAPTGNGRVQGIEWGFN